MSRKIDIIGKKFGRLTVVSESFGNSRTASICRCNCGNAKVVSNANLTRGLTKSCGCLRMEGIIKRSTKHGFSKRSSSHPVYMCWKAMRTRCENPKTKSWANYGGRGIKVSAEWHSFDVFRSDMLPTWKPGLTIERKNNSGNYEKTNCIWADRKTQNRNKRNAILITLDGETLNASTWSEKLGGNENLVRIRLRRGWSPERAASTPVKLYHAVP